MKNTKALQVVAGVTIIMSLSGPVMAHSKKKHDHYYGKGKKVVQEVIRYDKYAPHHEVIYYDQGYMTYTRYEERHYPKCKKTGRPIRLKEHHSFPYYLPYRVEEGRLPRFKERSISVRFD